MPAPEATEDLAVEYLDRALLAAAVVPDVPTSTPTRPVEIVGVIGAGTMGCGIAMAFANVGFQVVLNDLNLAAVERGMAHIRSVYASSVERARMSPEDARSRMSQISAVGSLADLGSCDLIVEAVYEDLQLKREIFRELDLVAKHGAILATNTSGLDIDSIASSTSRPHDVIGAHFFSPAHVQRLLEVVRGSSTSTDCIATLMSLARRLNKVGVVAGNHPGFIGNSLFRQYVREAHFMVEEGALPHEIDAALKDFGFAMGVFAVHDLAGNDVGWHTRKKQMADRATDRRWNDLILELCDAGRFGQKVGKGWYLYQDGSRSPIRDPELEAFIIARSERMNIQRRTVSNQEIIERCIFSMVNEAARLLETRVALRASDIDVVFVTGYGFPRDKGGPLYYADQVGLAHVYDRVASYHASHGYWWKPSPLLKLLAASGNTFASYMRES